MARLTLSSSKAAVTPGPTFSEELKEHAIVPFSHELVSSHQAVAGLLANEAVRGYRSEASQEHLTGISVD